MGTVILSVMIVMALHLPAQNSGCAEAISIVSNGVTAFEAGVPQIGPYTDVESYLAGALDYIEARCGD